MADAGLRGPPLAAQSPAPDAEAGSTVIARGHGWPSPENANRMGRPDGMLGQWSLVLDAASRRQGAGSWLLGVQERMSRA